MFLNTISAGAQFRSPGPTFICICRLRKRPACAGSKAGPATSRKLDSSQIKSRPLFIVVVRVHNPPVLGGVWPTWRFRVGGWRAAARQGAILVLHGPTFSSLERACQSRRDLLALIWAPPLGDSNSGSGSNNKCFLSLDLHWCGALPNWHSARLTRLCVGPGWCGAARHIDAPSRTKANPGARLTR